MILNSPESVGNSHVPLLGLFPPRWVGTTLDGVAPGVISQSYWWQAEKDASSTWRVEAANTLLLCCLLLRMGSTAGILIPGTCLTGDWHQLFDSVFSLPPQLCTWWEFQHGCYLQHLIQICVSILFPNPFSSNFSSLVKIFSKVFPMSYRCSSSIWGIMDVTHLFILWRWQIGENVLMIPLMFTALCLRCLFCL